MVLQNKITTIILYFFLFISIVASLTIGFRRFQLESRMSQVETALSLREAKQLSSLGGEQLLSFLSRLKESKTITSIVVEEDTLADFVDTGIVTVLKGSEVMNMYRVGHVNRFLLTHLYKQIKVKPEYFYLIIEKKADYERIRDFLTAEFGKEKVRRIGRLNILEVIDEKEDLMQIGLGISKKNLSDIHAAGFSPIVMLKNSNRLNQTLNRQKFLSFVEGDSIRTVMFEGETALGYPSLIPLTIDKLNHYNLNISLLEFSSLKGMSQIADALPERILRTHTIKAREMEKLSFNEAVSRYARAAKERGVKILLIRPFLDLYSQTNIINYNLDFFSAITESLKHFGLETTPIKTQAINLYSPAKPYELFLICLGGLVSMLFLFNTFIPLSNRQVLYSFILFILLFYLFTLFSQLTLLSLLMALCIAIVFPSLSIITQFPSESSLLIVKNRFLYALVYLVKILGFSLLGSVMIVGLLSQVDHIVGIQRFFGVKLSFIVPLAIIGLYFYLRPHRLSSVLFVFKRIFYAPVRTAGLISIVACLFFIITMVLRSGNYIFIPTFFFEKSIREFLELILWVRPRTKEFLIGYPFLFLSVLYVDQKISRNWLWFFAILGAVAPISIINSFCHVHTPLTISLFRTCLGLVLGILVTLFYIFFYKIIRYFHRKVS